MKLVQQRSITAAEKRNCDKDFGNISDPNMSLIVYNKAATKQKEIWPKTSLL